MVLRPEMTKVHIHRLLHLARATVKVQCLSWGAVRSSMEVVSPPVALFGQIMMTMTETLDNLILISAR